jgi:serine-type D-Ala-D-Ala carboxypeptidase/endopeptidase
MFSRARRSLVSWSASLFGTLLASMIFSAPALAQKGFKPIPKKTLQTAIEGYVTPYLTYPNLGFTIVTVQPGNNGKGIAEYSFFVGNLVKESDQKHLAFNSSTEFEIGSNTKTFTTTLLGTIVQNNASILTQPADSYLSAVPIDTATSTPTHITIGELATYSSGLPDSDLTPNNSDCTDLFSNCFTIDQMITNLMSFSSHRAPNICIRTLPSQRSR